MIDWVLIGILFAIVYWLIFKFQYPEHFPPGPRHWIPFVGDALFAVGLDTTLGYRKLHEKYGPLVGVYISGRRFISIGDFDILQELYSQEQFSYRPVQKGMQYYRHGAVLEDSVPGIIFSSGHTWKDNRRFTLRTLRDFGFGKTSMSEIAEYELDNLLKKLESQNGQPIETYELFNIPVINALWRILTGERLNRSGSMLGYIAFNSLPALLILEKLGLVKIKKGLDFCFDIAKDQISEHEKTFQPHNIRDFTDWFIHQRIQVADYPGKEFAHLNLSNIYLDLFFAGSETTSSTLKWGLLYMVLYPEEQQKIQDEIDMVMKKNPGCLISDLRSKMPYTDAALLEIQRLGNVLPSALLHATIAPTRIGDYVIPAGTSIVSNMYGILMNPKVFPEPEVFRPQRFIDSDTGAFVAHPHVIPFGIGKRKCLGEAMARLEFFTFFTGMLRKFNLELPDGEKPPSTMYRPGMTICPQPFKICFVPRN